MLFLQKAFDTVNHSILLNKLKATSFHNTSVNWMKSTGENKSLSLPVKLVSFSHWS